MLEMARIFWANRSSLSRTVRIAWWPGHSTGRYAGSTWYADHFARDLLENCVAHVNCDSPGCRGALSFSRVTSQVELDEFTKKAVLDATGEKATIERPGRAGDYSFYNLGLPSTMMLSSTLPDSVRKEQGLYEVGGCGGNNEWHTEDDTLALADREILVRDTKLYALIVWRLANLPINPTDFAATTNEILAFAKSYQEKCAGKCEFGPVFAEAEGLAGELSALYGSLAGRVDKLGAGKLEALNSVLRRVGRLLVEIDYSHTGRFRQDPAQPMMPLPDLAWAEDLAQLEPGSSLFDFTMHSLTRGLNRVLVSLSEARRLVSEANRILAN